MGSLTTAIIVSLIRSYKNKSYRLQKFVSYTYMAQKKVIPGAIKLPDES